LNLKTKKLIEGHGAFFLATIFVAGSAIACKLVTDSMHPLPLTLLRFIIAFVTLAPFVLMKHSFRIQVRRALPRSLVISFFYSFFFVLMFDALRYTSTLNVSSIGTLSPLITALFSIVLFNIRIGLKKLLVYLIAVLGTLLVVFDGNFNAIIHISLNHGDMVFFIATMLISCYYIALKKLHGGIDPLVLTFCTLFGGMIWISCSMLVMQVPFDFHGLTTTSDIMSLFYLAIITTTGTAYLMQKGSTLISPTSGSAYQYMAPVFVSVLSIIFLGVFPSLMGWIGAIIAVVSTIILLCMDK